MVNAERESVTGFEGSAPTESRAKPMNRGSKLFCIITI